MIPFLKAVARAYVTRYEDLSNFCFVFPNKRSGTFFLKYLRSAKKNGGIAPEIMTITDFVARVGDCVVDNRISSLFTLYHCYCALLPAKSRPDFDSFRTWGETVLSDFNEVGMNCADPEALFKNLKDHREISTDFLTDDQRRIMEEYFGVTPYKKDEERFWNHFNTGKEKQPDTESSEIREMPEDADPKGDGEKAASGQKGKIPLRKRFLKLWETLWPLYQSFHKALEGKGLVSSSGAYRAALATLEEKGKDCLIWDKIVFVGFNALTHVEIDIFSELRDMGEMATGPHPEDSLADFIWDATGPIFSRTREGDKKRKNSATRFVSANLRRFPEPEWARKILDSSNTDSLPPKLRAIASPSNVMQAKLAAAEVERISKDVKKKDIADAKVVVVLPDENILVPFLYALPDGVTDVNLTMGFPMRHTSIYTFVTRLRMTLRSSRTKKEQVLFYYPDLKLFLAHPVVRLLAGEKAIGKFMEKAERYHQVFVSLTQLREKLPGLSPILRIPAPDAPAASVIAYIDDVLSMVDNALTGMEAGLLKSGVEEDYIEAFRVALRPLRQALEEDGIEMSRDTALAMIQRVVGNLRIRFEGEPLRGLQIMGLLETRLLDFDIVIIPSLNERILPMKARTRTFIPNALRAAYGLPPSNYSENLFSYYFYRLISRAREVVMLYDARSGSGLRSGGASRYIHQLEHLFAPDSLEQTEATFRLSDSGTTLEPIEKTPEVEKVLNEYIYNPEAKDPLKGKVLSATGINDYCKCEKYFFFKYIVKIPDTRESTIHVDNIQLGNMVHNVMECLYSPEANGNGSPLKVDVAFIDRLLSEEDTAILRLATKSMFSEFEFLSKGNGLLPPDYEIVRDTVVRMVRGILLNDRRIAMESRSGYLIILGCETKGVKILRTPEGREVKFRYAIDRADVVDGQFRIVDYKTGAIHAKGRDFDEMFQGNSVGLTNFLQLMAYASIARDIWPEATKNGVAMVLYQVTEMSREHKKDAASAMVKPRLVEKDSQSGEETERTFESDEVVVLKRKLGNRRSEESVEEGPEYREDFDYMLGQKIDTLFDNPVFEPTENSQICENCPYAPFCLR